jgi:hypothetical protein
VPLRLGVEGRQSPARIATARLASAGEWVDVLASMVETSASRARRTSMAALSAVFLVACGSSDNPPAPTPTVYAAYVVLGPGADGATLAFARTIVEPGDPACPSLRGGQGSIAMHLRANPFGFPVNVCEARVPFGRRFRLSWTGQALPVARRNPTRLTLIGDTGCDPQDCAPGTPASPFAALATTAAQQPSDLVIHVGDYNYRGTPGSIVVNGSTRAVYDAGDNAPEDAECQLDSPYVSQNAAYSAEPDTWENWWTEFFEPAAPLLAAAPWVVVRGNHELCSRGGPGWFYFLDPGAPTSLGGSGERECPPQGDDQPLPPPVLPYLVFTPPYVLDLGTLQIAVIDSANACDGHAPATTTELYSEQLADVRAAAHADTPTWIATHRPIWGATDIAGASIDLTLQQAWATARATDPNAPIALVLAGHIHTFQSVTFAEPELGRPPQLIVGDGGVKLDRAAPVGPFDAVVDGENAALLGLQQFGFIHVPRLERDGSWSGDLLDVDGDAIATCATGNLPGSLCVLE